MSMTKQKSSPTEIRFPKQWYVMYHLEPEEIDRKMQLENEHRREKGLRLFEYFIPYLFLPVAEPDLYADDAKAQVVRAGEVNDLRRAIRRYVFVKASAREIASLVRRDWNRDARVRLYFCNSHDGSHVVMGDKPMQQFITVCCDNRQRFTFGPPVVDVEKYDTVVIKNGAFKDSEAKVLDVQQTASGLSITLGIPFFCGEKTLQLKGCTADDIHLPRTVETLLNDHFVDNVEKKLLTVLAHRLKGIVGEYTDGEESDEASLNRISHYAYVSMPDTRSHIRFRCLMLLCAALRIDSVIRESMAAEIGSLLDSGKDIDDAGKALIQASLYVATGNADCRTSAKTYWQAHREEQTTLSRLMPLVTRLNRRFFKHHKI